MDTLARTIKLEALGFERPKAEGLVQMVKQSIDEEVAKRADLRELRADLKSDISEVRLEIGQVKSELKQDIAEVRLEVGQVKSELKHDISEVRLEIGQVKTELKFDVTNLKADIGELKGTVKVLDQKIDVFAIDLNGKIESMGRDLHFKLGRLMLGLFTLFCAVLVFIEPLKRRLGVDQDSIVRNEQASKIIKPSKKP